MSGRWVGVAPEGMIVESNPFNCPAELDLELTLTSDGGTVTGTAVTRLRATNFACTDVFGQVAAYGVLNGKVDGNAISFNLGDAYRMTASFTANRMTGTFAHIEISATGRLALTRQ